MTSDIKAWVKAALIRALKTAAQTSVALIGTTAMGITDVDWIGVASGATLAAIVSLLTSIAGLPEVADGQSIKQIMKTEED